MTKNTFIPTTKGLVSATKSQSFSGGEQAQARSNIGLAAIAASASASDLLTGTVPNARLSPQVVRNDLSYSDPAWITALAASKITGTLSKSQQHSQTAYLDQANTFSQAQTFQIATGNSTRSILATFRNLSDVAGAGNDYENEVHLVLQAGTSANHRRYIDFKNYDGTDAYLMGVNASGNFILYDSALGHRMYGATSGLTQLNSFGSTAVEVNNYPGPDELGTGGFKVYSGGASAGRSLWFSVDSANIVANKQIVQSSSQDSTQLALTATGSGYAPASILLQATQSTTRGQGIFHYNTESNTSWFAGVPYASSGAKWMLGFQSTGTWGAGVADESNALMIINSAGAATFNGNLTATGTGNHQFGTGTAYSILANGAITNYIGNGGRFSIADQWWIYKNNDDANMYFRDMVNARMQMTFVPGTSASAALTHIFSRLNVEGDVSAGSATFNGAVSSPTFRHVNSAGEFPWMLYSPGTDINYYIRDLVNSRMQMTFSPGASASAALTQIHSQLTVEGAATLSGIAKLGDFTVGTLPSAVANAGYECNVTDSSVTTFGSTVAGGGSSRVKLYSNGTNWTVQAA
jgi:hypothetical protein